MGLRDVGTVLVSMFIPLFLCAQSNLPDFNHGNQLTVLQGDTIYMIRVGQPKKGFEPVTDMTYTWFDKGRLGRSQGGYSGQLLDGRLVVKKKSGQLIRQGDYKMGLKIGTWLEWHDNGVVRSSIEWKNGIRHGAFASYDDKGRIKVKGTNRKGQMHGKFTEYLNGTPLKVRNYRNGVEIIKPPIEKKEPEKKPTVNPDTKIGALIGHKINSTNPLLVLFA